MDNRDYFQEAATVPSSEEIFNMDEYSDAVMITKPQITISPVDIYYLHKMLSVNVDQLVDEGDNQLPEILKDLGSLGDEVEELGEEGLPYMILLFSFIFDVKFSAFLIGHLWHYLSKCSPYT